MLFNSVEYLFFLPFVFIVYWLLQRQLKAQNIFVLAVSYFFYGLWDYRFLSLIIISSLLDFLIGLNLSKTKVPAKRKVLLGCSLFVNLGFLFFFKYFNFFVDSFATLLGNFNIPVHLPTLSIILPVGISFYTFQTLSYTIDIYRGKLEPTKSIINFFAYVAFFPQLVAGPIERASNLLPQFEKNRVFDYETAKDGMRQILWGLFKKVVVADNCAKFVDVIFANYADLNGLILLIGGVFFTIQIYSDFSGYSDIAIGTAKLLGIRLMQNFATPFFARDIAEFWRRWHISLSTWFRDYLYIPLGGSRGGTSMRIRNTFAIFLVSGFWHGANWTFIFWGLIHALLYIPLFLSKKNRKYLDVVAQGKWLPSFSELLRMGYTFLMVMLAFIFFRSVSVTDSFYYLINMFQLGTDSIFTILSVLGLNKLHLFLNFIFIGILIIVEWINRTQQHGLEQMFSNMFLRYGFYVFLLSLIHI